MNSADEKRAFEEMMGEISDSDSDGEENENNSKTAYYAAAPKNAPRQEYQLSKMTQEDEDIANFGCGPGGEKQPVMEQQTEQINVLKRWLTRPCAPGDPPVMCYVERHRVGFGRINPTYKCFLEGNGGKSSRFLMTAKKKNGSKTSYYLISLDMDHQGDRGSESVLGKVRGNSVGSQYLITDHGIAPDKAVAPSMLRKELGLVRFEFDSGGPSRIEAFIPSVNSVGAAITWQPSSEELGMNAKIDDRQYSNLLPLVNKKPKWDDAHGGHVLNFQGRVTESSVKNFQLCPADYPSFSVAESVQRSGGSGSDLNEDVVLQFGRVAKHKFTLDVRYPMSPMQAFAISVACMDGKIADRKGYEYMRKFTASDTVDNNDQAKGSVVGNRSFRGALAQSMPSSQYIKDKFSRTFK